MRNAIIVALGLVCAALILSNATTGAERRLKGGSGEESGSPTAADSVPVAVQNFPASQHVTGTVDIRTFPHTVNVQGTVDVGNLPLDAEGNVRVSRSMEGAPRFRLIELPGPIVVPSGSFTFTDIIDVSGW